MVEKDCWLVLLPFAVYNESVPVDEAAVQSALSKSKLQCICISFSLTYRYSELLGSDRPSSLCRYVEHKAPSQQYIDNNPIEAPQHSASECPNELRNVCTIFLFIYFLFLY